MAIQKKTAFAAAKAYGKGKAGFQPALQYCVEQAFRGNANEATEIFKSARMIGSTGKLLADGKSVVDYMELELDFLLLQFDSNTGSFKMKKDWQASVDGMDLAAMWVTLQERPWYDWKKETAPASDPSLVVAIGRLEKQFKKIQNITLEDQKTALDSLAILATAIKNLPIREPETDATASTMTLEAKSDNPEQLTEAMTETNKIQDKLAELLENQTKISKNATAATDEQERQFWMDVAKSGQRQMDAARTQLH